jgi:hypothetical protein
MARNKTTEEQIFQLAIDALRKLPLQAQIETVERQPCCTVDLHPDMLLRIVIQGKELHYYAEIKTVITQTNRLLFLMHKGRLPYPLLVIAKYINPHMAEQLAHDGIEFIDTTGNTFISRRCIFLSKGTDLLRRLDKLQSRGFSSQQVSR